MVPSVVPSSGRIAELPHSIISYLQLYRLQLLADAVGACDWFALRTQHISYLFISQILAKFRFSAKFR